MWSASRSTLAALLTRLQATTAGIPLFGRLAVLLRKIVVAAGDPLLRFRIGRFDVLLPLSHRLPDYKRIFPLYDTALGRLAALVQAKYEGAAMVDVGANVGDTAAVIRSEVAAPLLCIEGDERFFALLEQNALGLGPNIFLERAFVGGTPAVVRSSLKSQWGTARLVESCSGQVELSSLEQVLSRHPGLPRPSLVKIDTDGFDCLIVQGGVRLWRELKPVLFFEYDPAFYPGWDPFPMWDALSAADYDQAIVLDNTGSYQLSADLRDRVALEDLHLRYSGWNHQRYADLAVFHARDRDIAGMFRDSELRATLALRGVDRPSPRRFIERPR